MNEFRKFIGLKPFESFEEWNSDKEIAKAAMHLYEHIDNLELYPGLQAEEAKKPGDGAGLCAGFTVTRGLLADAVSVTRGDRFLTTDFTPFNLTSWGYLDCARDENNGSNGGMLGKLLFRTMGECYSAGSVYAHFPFVVPPTMEHYLIKQGVAHKYNFKRPKHIHEPVAVNTFQGVKQVLGDMRIFRTTYSQSMNDLTKGHGFFLAFDEPSKHRAERVMMYRALYSPGALDHYAGFYGSTTARLIGLKSYESRKGTMNVDIVRDVINLVPVHWICEEVAGIPLKSDLAPHGIHTEQEVYQMITVVFTFIFLNVDPVHSWVLRENALKVATILQGYIKARLQKVAAGNSLFSLSGLRDSVTHWLTGQEDHSDIFLRNLLLHGAANHSMDELSYNVFGLIVASVANYAQAMTHVVDFYLDEERAKERKHIKSLVMDPDSDELLAGYVREAMRLYPQAPGIFRDVHNDAEIFEGHDLPSIRVKKGDRLWVSLAKANVDSDAFPNPLVVNPARDPQQYSSFGRSEHSCLGELFCDKTMPQMMRAIFSLKNVRRAPGQSGRLKGYTQDLHGTKQHMYINAKGMVTPWPASMVLQYDC
jgi:cytochrome P450